MRTGLKKAREARAAQVRGPRYLSHRNLTELVWWICHLDRSSIVYSRSEPFVTAVVVSPQFSS